MSCRPRGKAKSIKGHVVVQAGERRVSGDIGPEIGVKIFQLPDSAAWVARWAGDKPATRVHTPTAEQRIPFTGGPYHCSHLDDLVVSKATSKGGNQVRWTLTGRPKQA